MNGLTVTTPARATRHPMLELLGRYRDVLGAAWAMRRELHGPKRLADEAAFLPAALEIQETPAHPAPRRAAWIIMGLFTAALMWSYFGQVDIVAVAQGRVVVSDRTKVVQPLEAGVIRAIHARDGDKVQTGQVLIELDPTVVLADQKGLSEQRRSVTNEAGRADALLEAVRTGRTPSSIADSEAHAQLAAEWAEITARLERLDAEILRRVAETNTVREFISKLRSTLPLVRQREADFKMLSAQGFVSGHVGQDRMRERIEIERDLSAQTARMREAEAALYESRKAKLAFLAEIQRSLSDRSVKANQELAQLDQQGIKSAQREQLTKLRAPVSGTVQQLAVHSTGGVVTPAQTLMVVVPEGAGVIAEVIVENKDIGHVREGDRAEIKLETFPFTRYGTVPAVVTRVSADAVPDERRGAVFALTLALQQQHIEVDGQRVSLAPGMNLTAEVKTGRRRVIEYLLAPVQRSMSESLKER